MISRATNFSRQVELINAASGGANTCVFVPPPQMGLGCKCALLREPVKSSASSVYWRSVQSPRWGLGCKRAPANSQHFSDHVPLTWDAMPRACPETASDW